jgi:RimJ/RimL family protein N-acetyltransferase
VSDELAGIWPLLALRITTPRLELAVPSTDDLLNLAQASREIQPPDEIRFQQAFLYESSPLRERQLLQHHWRALAHWQPHSWDLHLAVRVDGVAIGLQNMWAADFATVRTVETGSWITRRHQGRGLGTEARAAMLELAFAHLDALEARTSYIAGNTASAAVSRKLGYVDNGHRAVSREGVRMVEHTLALTRESWQARQVPGIQIYEIAPCLELFGLD